MLPEEEARTQLHTDNTPPVKCYFLHGGRVGHNLIEESAEMALLLGSPPRD